MATPSFTSLPILSIEDARNPKLKPQFLNDLRNALLHVGFLYLRDTGIHDALFDRVAEQTHLFFDEAVMPLREKEKIEMKNQKSFLGWSRLDNETTAGHADHREQLDLSTEHPIPGPDQPLYHNLLAPNQWPAESHLPDFKPVFEEYMRQLSSLSTFFTSLIAEAIGLEPTAFERFFDADQQHKLKVVKYPEAPPSTSDDPLARQGVGPHKDSMLSSYLFQVTPQAGLQVQNLDGLWIDAVPVPRTLVVAFGQGLEALTGGVCASTTHRVLSPRAGEGARYSVPFFQGVSYDAEFERMDVPERVRDLKQRAVDSAASTETRTTTTTATTLLACSGGASGEEALSRHRQDDVEFTFRPGQWKHLGEATLANRVKSHPDVGERWYPDLLAKIRQQQVVQKPICQDCMNGR